MQPVLTINTTKPCNLYFLASLEELWEKLSRIKKTLYIIIDTKVANNYGKSLKSYLKNTPTKYFIFYLEANEKNKSLSTYNKVCKWFIKNNGNKNSYIVALGGGITGDIVGFCASTLARGIPFIQIPTTLLSMVDSSVGGKNALNTIYAKNSLGTIYQPEMVLIYPRFLETLNYQELRSGFAEVIKYSCLFSEEFFYYLKSNGEKLYSLDEEFIYNIIYKSCQYKKDIVESDEFETKDIRSLLNLGHTFGHALEKYNNYKNNLKHGEAVAIGLILAFKFAAFLGKCSSENAKEVEQYITSFNYPSLAELLPNLNIAKYMEILQKDKKHTNDLTFILPLAIGNCIIVKGISQDTVAKFLKERKGN